MTNARCHNINDQWHDRAPGLPEGMQYNDQVEPMLAQFADGCVEINPDKLK